MGGKDDRKGILPGDIEMLLFSGGRVEEHLFISTTDDDFATHVAAVEDDEKSANAGGVVVLAVFELCQRFFCLVVAGDLTCDDLATSSPSPTNGGFGAE